MPQLEITDRGETIAISFDDLLKYHGRGFIGGVAHGFKVMERAFGLLSPGKSPDRYQVTIATAFPGPGARDAFEMVARAVTGGRYSFDAKLGPADVIEAASGRYFFRVGYAGASVDLVLRPNIVRDEFIALSRKGTEHGNGLSPAEVERLEWHKRDMAERILATPAEGVYAVRA